MTAEYTPIVGKGNEGQFVHDNQEMGTKAGFKNVSQLWLDKTFDYDHGFEQLEKDIQKREDIICPVHHMAPIVTEVTEDKQTRMRVVFAFDDGREFRLDDWSMTQYCQKIGVPQSIFTHLDQNDGKITRDEKDARILQALIVNALRRVPKDKKFRFRTYNGDTIRAVLSKDYVIVDNRWYLEVLKECIPGGRLSHWRGDADTMYGNILIPDSIRQETDSDYGGMVSVGNCEIGKRRLSQCPSVFRAICMNGCIWDQTKGKNIRQVHRGKQIADQKTLRVQIAENIQYQIPLFSKGIDRILATQKFGIDKMKNFIAEVGHSWGMKPEECREVVKQFHGFESAHRNLFGVVNAITRAGQQFEPKRWVDFDMFAGELIAATPDSFSRMKARSENLSDEFVNEVYGLAV